MSMRMNSEEILSFNSVLSVIGNREKDYIEQIHLFSSSPILDRIFPSSLYISNVLKGSFRFIILTLQAFERTISLHVLTCAYLLKFCFFMDQVLRIVCIPFVSKLFIQMCFKF